jgi:osomolarity two-component system, sensor histidine kinase TcsA
MEGRLGFRPNSAGIGSIFWFTVTMSRAQNIPINPSIDDLSRSIRNVSADKRILLVEDNVVNQRVMSKILINLGFTEMDIANNGQQGVEYAQQTNYDLILMDINMPILKGVDATKEIRRSGITVPIVAVTANALKSDSETFLAAGISDYITKPVDKHLLIALLAKWLIERDRSADAGELRSA